MINLLASFTESIPWGKAFYLNSHLLHLNADREEDSLKGKNPYVRSELGNGNTWSVPLLELHPIKWWLVGTDGSWNQRIARPTGMKFSGCFKGGSWNWPFGQQEIKRENLYIKHIPVIFSLCIFKYWIASWKHENLSLEGATFLLPWAEFSTPGIPWIY